MEETDWYVLLIEADTRWFYNTNKHRFEPPGVVYNWYMDYTYLGYYEDLWRYPVIWNNK